MSLGKITTKHFINIVGKIVSKVKAKFQTYFWFNSEEVRALAVLLWNHPYTGISVHSMLYV